MIYDRVFATFGSLVFMYDGEILYGRMIAERKLKTSHEDDNERRARWQREYRIRQKNKLLSLKDGT